MGSARPKSALRLALLALLAGFAVATLGMTACGSDDAGPVQPQVTVTNSPAEVAQGQDAKAKSSARNAYTSVASCFVDTQSYAKCTSIPELAELGAKIKDVTADRVELSVTSETGTVFTLAGSTSTGIERKCTGNSPGCRGGA